MADPLPAVVNAIGVMSGTSMDAIDVALIQSDGEQIHHLGPYASFAYPADTRLALLDLIADPTRIENGDLSTIERKVTDAHCDAVLNFMAENSLTADDVDLVGFHGQTILHRPDRRFTCQLLDGAYAAGKLGMNVVNRFRHRDIAAGGQGAPLAPLYHRALTEKFEKPIAVLNLGGVANVTFIDKNHMVAFDTGPASALMDDMMRARCGLDYDRDGHHARAGKIDSARVTEFLSDPYFLRIPPKSLDRNDFHRWMALVEPLDLHDALATLSAFTVESVAKARAYCNSAPETWLVCGGGRKNSFLMDRLEIRLGVPVKPVEAVGWNGDMLEAECFAWLAIRSVRGLPLSLPSTTGVPEPMTGGEFHRIKKAVSA